MVQILECSYDGPEMVEPGERINFGVDVEVGNGDPTPAEFTLGLFVDGSEVARSPGSLDGTTKGTVTVRGSWDAPGTARDFDVNVRVLSEESIAGDPELTSITVDPSTVEKGEPLRVRTEINPNGASTEVTAIYSVAGRDVGTETASVSPRTRRGPAPNFEAQIPYDRLVRQGVAPSSGRLETTVAARLSGESSPAAEDSVTFDAGGEDGGDGDPSPTPGPGGPPVFPGDPGPDPDPVEPSTTVESVRLSPATVSPGEEFTVSVTVRRTGPAEDVGVRIRGAGRGFATASKRVTQGTNVLAQRIGYDRLLRRGLAPRRGGGSIDIPITVVLGGETFEADRELTVSGGSSGRAPKRGDAAVPFR